MSSYIEETKSNAIQFYHDSINFIMRCSKPSKKEYVKITVSCAIGFFIMGIIGYLIKLLFIPINNILLS